MGSTEDAIVESGSAHAGVATTLPRRKLSPSPTAALLAFSLDTSVLQPLGDDLGSTHQLLQE